MTTCINLQLFAISQFDYLIWHNFKLTNLTTKGLIDISEMLHSKLINEQIKNLCCCIQQQKSVLVEQQIFVSVDIEYVDIRRIHIL